MMNKGRISKVIMYLLVFGIIVGCQNKSNETDAVDASKVSENQWGYSAQYNVNEGIPVWYNHAVNTKDKLILLKRVVENDNGGELLLEVDKKDASLKPVNNDVTNNCSIDNPTVCSGYIEENLEDIKYYNNHLYYFYSDVNAETNKYEIVISEMDLDGGNKDEKLRLTLQLEQEGNSFIGTFHNGYLYSILSNELIKINVDNWEYESVLKNEKGSLFGMQFHQDKLFIFATNYIYEGKSYATADVEIDLKNNDILSVKQVRDGSMHEDDKFMFPYDMSGQYLLNKENNNEVKLGSAWGNIVVSEKYYLVSLTNEIEQNRFVLLNKNGEVTDEHAIINGGSHAILLEDDLFYYLENITDNEGVVVERILHRVDIKDGLFGDDKALFTY